jgi:hypothetical protein
MSVKMPAIMIKVKFNDTFPKLKLWTPSKPPGTLESKALALVKITTDENCYVFHQPAI